VIDGAEPERVAAYIVTPNIFDLLGATPMLGRSFVEGDGALNAPAVVVLSHALWQRRFGADRTLVGKSVSISGVMRTVVGVMPPDIRFPDAPVSFLREPAELWVPTGWTQQRGDSRGNQILALLARLRPGVPLAQGQSELDRVAAGFRRAYPERYASATSKNWKLQAVPLREEMVGGVRDGLLIIAGAVGLVLLIACVNVANLLLARGATRQREFAIRQALGAGRGRLVRQLLTESVVLTFSGGIVGLALGWAGVRLLVAYGASGIPRVADATINANVLAVSFGLSVFSGIFVGLFPAIDRSLGGGRAASSATTRGATAGRHRLRSVLVSAQVAMALVVLVAAGLLTRSFVALEQVKLGFDAEHVASFQLTTPRVKYDSLSKVVAFYEQIQTAIASLPGVSSASAVYPLPMSDDGWSGSFRVDGEPDGPNDPIPHAEYAATMPGYFRTLGIRLISGREFAATDVKGSPAVVVVDEQLAREHWPHESAINKRIGSPGQWMTVIGVVGHVHNAGPRTSGEPQLYLPFLQSPQSTMSIVARSDASVASLAPALRTAVYAVDRAMPVAKLRPVSEFVTAGFAKQRFDMLLIAAFAVTALVLAMVGLYGVIAYLVTQRTREIGIRMALGGRASSIKVMVLREGIFITLTGILVGGAAAVLLTRLLAEQLFAVSTFDPLTYVTIACALAVVAVVASYGPARRATEIDPMAALRD
jgi:putative ABC transport system permease protein